MSDYLRDILSRGHLPYSLELVQDVDAIVASGVASVPSAAINGGPPIVEEDFATFRDFCDAVVAAALQPHHYGDLPQIALPIQPDYDFRPGLMYGYQLASRSQSVLRLEPSAKGPMPADVQAAIITLQQSTADIALDRPLLFFNEELAPFNTTLTIWPYGIDHDQKLAGNVLYLPVDVSYRKGLTACYHDSATLPAFVTKIWPDIQHCREVSETVDLIITTKLEGPLLKPTLFIPALKTT